MRRPRREKQRQVIRKEIEVTCKTEGQQEYLQAILEEDLIICSGPAGSGKSYIAMGAALKLVHENPDKYKRIIMARPYIVLDGEDMGFLPGDANEKLKPFMRPLLDNMRNFIDMGLMQTLLGQGAIEFIPVAHMRGLTYNNCIVIFDEAQNARKEHMRMFLTRLGNNCKAIVEGDVTQSDLKGDDAEENGLSWAMSRLDDVDGVAVIEMLQEDIVRSDIVKRIIGKL